MLKKKKKEKEKGKTRTSNYSTFLWWSSESLRLASFISVLLTNDFSDGP